MWWLDLELLFPVFFALLLVVDCYPILEQDTPMNFQQRFHVVARSKTWLIHSLGFPFFYTLLVFVDLSMECCDALVFLYCFLSAWTIWERMYTVFPFRLDPSFIILIVATEKASCNWLWHVKEALFPPHVQ